MAMEIIVLSVKVIIIISYSFRFYDRFFVNIVNLVVSLCVSIDGMMSIKITVVEALLTKFSGF